MSYKFEKLDVWNRSLAYADQMYDLAANLPSHERYNLADQMKRAANSIALNIAEGSTGTSDREHDRYLRIAIRSLLETVACLHLVKRREYVDVQELRDAYRKSETLFAQLQAFRSSIKGDSSVHESDTHYEDEPPF